MIQKTSGLNRDILISPGEWDYKPLTAKHTFRKYLHAESNRPSSIFVDWAFLLGFGKSCSMGRELYL